MKSKMVKGLVWTRVPSGATLKQKIENVTIDKER